jgi:hypothetical protein
MPLLVVAPAPLVDRPGGRARSGREIVSAFGKAFNDTRYVSVVWIVLPVIALLERHGLQERARSLIEGTEGRDLCPAAHRLSAAAPVDCGAGPDLDRRPRPDGSAIACRADGRGCRRSAG